MAIGGKTLTVYLAADVSKLKSGLNSADRSLSGFGKNLSSMVGPALIGATAAAGAFAVAMAVDGVQAAIQEQAELEKLGTALDNLGFGAQSDEINKFIDDLQYTAGVSDSTLRPAFQRLLTSTNDVTQSQKLLSLALDVSAGTGKSLEAVTNALGKAYDGNLGALGKLGAGIDSSTIKSKDLDGALAQLSSTFSGQATAAAGTLQGQIKILGISFDELKESFGTGFLNGMGSAAGSVGDLSDLLRESQKMAEDLGQSVGELAVELLTLANDAWKAYNAFDAWTKNTGMGKVVGFMGDLLNLANPFSMLRNALEGVTGATDDSTNALASNVKGLILWTNTAMQVDKYVRGGYSGIPASVSFNSLDTLMEKLNKVQTTTTNTTNSTGGMTKAVKAMDPALRAQIDLVKDLTNKVQDAGKALESARKEMNDWISSMAGNITSGINLGTAFDAMFNTEGEKTGQSLLDGFQKQIDQAGIFGGYLKKLNAEGGPELRDAVAALGPEAGNKLAKEIIDQGLIPTMQSKLVDVQSMAETTAAEMVPPMLVAGVASAAGYLLKMQTELDNSSSLLEEMGRKMGKTLSDPMVEEIRAALAAAGVAQTGASNVMAGLPADAISAQAQVAQRIDNPFMNSTAIMQAIQNAIQQSDQRLGRTGQVLNA